MVEIKLSFNSVEAAIVALDKLRSAPALKDSSAPKREPQAEAPAEQSARASAVPAAAAAGEPIKQRAGRSDKGKPRGSYKNVAAEGTKAPQEPVSAAQTQTPAAAPEAAVESAPGAGARPAVGGQSTSPGEATGSTAAPIDDKTVQEALQKFHAAKGTQAAMDLLARYGVKRGRDLLPRQRADFVKECQAGAGQ